MKAYRHVEKCQDCDWQKEYILPYRNEKARYDDPTYNLTHAKDEEGVAADGSPIFYACGKVEGTIEEIELSPELTEIAIPIWQKKGLYQAND